MLSIAGAGALVCPSSPAPSARQRRGLRQPLSVPTLAWPKDPTKGCGCDTRSSVSQDGFGQGKEKLAEAHEVAMPWGLSRRARRLTKAKCIHSMAES